MNFIQISCGGHHSLLLNEDGLVFSFGKNEYGQLGLGNKIDQTTPQLITSLENIRIKKISCGRDHSLLLSEDGLIYSFGFNQFGQLGLGNFDNQSTPQLIRSLENIRIKNISCG